MADSPRARERRLTYGSALPMPTAGPSLPPSLLPSLPPAPRGRAGEYIHRIGALAPFPIPIPGPSSQSLRVNCSGVSGLGTTGLSKRNGAKFRELILNFPKLADCLCMGWLSCLAALGRKFSDRGTFILHRPVHVPEISPCHSVTLPFFVSFVMWLKSSI